MRQLPIFLCDYYKLCHADQYDERINKLVSYSTPRGCRLPGKDYVINFGIQAFCKKYLIDAYNKEFFDVPAYEVERITRSFLTNTLPGVDIEKSVERIMKLHKLGYLPISIRTLPEGSKVSLKCPNVELVTTHPDFPWIGGYIESLFSSDSWKPMLDATVGHWYRETANKYYEMTVDDWQSKARSAMSEFGFRGADSPESGIGSGAAWLLSFNKTATCSAIPYINKYYNTCLPDEVVDITEYVGKYHEYLIKCGSEKLDNELNHFMYDNRDWHSNSEFNKETGEYVTALPLGYDELPDWLIPRESWYSGKKFSINDSMLVVKEGKNNWTTIPFDIDVVGQGLISTEHSVMCSSTSLEMEKGFDQKEAEKNVVKRLLTEVYPHSSFSMVSDSYDYWRLVTEILPKLKDDILERNQENGNSATLFVRGDSGDPVKIVAGYIDVTDLSLPGKEEFDRRIDIANRCLEVISKDMFTDKCEEKWEIDNLVKNLNMTITLSDKYSDVCNKIINESNYLKSLINESEINNSDWDFLNDSTFRLKAEYNNLKKELCYYRRNGKCYRVSDDSEIPSYVVKGTVEVLWDTFGGTVNSKGYKVLDPHIRAIYGDSITQQRQEMIYKILELKGFSVENVALGAGSFSFHAYEKDGVLYPYTRDTMNYCMKNTYAEYSKEVKSTTTGNGSPSKSWIYGNSHIHTSIEKHQESVMVYKDPKTDNENFKRSQRGCCAVYKTETDKYGNYYYYLDHDGLTLEERESDIDIAFEEIFRDGKMIKEVTFKEVREVLNEGKF